MELVILLGLEGISIMKDWMVLLDMGIVACGWVEVALATRLEAFSLLKRHGGADAFIRRPGISYQGPSCSAPGAYCSANSWPRQEFHPKTFKKTHEILLVEPKLSLNWHSERRTSHGISL